MKDGSDFSYIWVGNLLIVVISFVVYFFVFNVYFFVIIIVYICW